MYVFMAVAPCSFSIGGKSYKLSAGSTFSISKELGEQLRQPTFPFRKHLRLMSQLDQVEVKEKNPQKPVAEPVKEKAEAQPVTESKVEEKKVESTLGKTKRVVKKSEV